MTFGNVSETIRYLLSRSFNQYDYVRSISEVCPNFPYLIYVEPTNICNLRCIHCMQNAMKRKRGVMTFETFKKIIDEMAEYHGAITMNLQGEPLLNKQICSFVEYSMQKKVFTSILTNATTLTENISDNLIANRLNRIVFSFDSPEKQIYEQIRINAKFEETFKNILYFIEANKNAGFPVYVCISMVIEEKNMHKIDEYTDFFYKLPINEVFASPLLNQLGGTECSPDEGLENFDKHPKEDWPICRVPWDHMGVNWNGDVVGCTIDYEGRHILGNVNDKSLKDLWNSKQMKILRKCLLDKDYSEIEKNGKYCGHCNAMWLEGYDIRNYKDFMNSYLVREISQLGPKIGKVGNSKKEIDSKIQYLNTIKEKLKKKEPLE